MIERRYEPLKFKKQAKYLEKSKRILEEYFYKKITFHEALKRMEECVVNDGIRQGQFVEFLQMTGYPVDL